MQPASTFQGISQKEKEREEHGDPSLWWNKGALLNSVWVYIPYYKVASSDKDQKARLYNLPRKQGVIEAIKPKDNLYQKRVVNNHFLHMEKLMKGLLCMHSISWPQSWDACCWAHSWQELMRKRGLRRDRKQHPGIPLSNNPWQWRADSF